MQDERAGDPVSVPPPAPVAIPARIGVYRVLREIGRGGTGVVYEADAPMDSSVGALAIRIMHVAGDAELQQRVLAERRSLPGSSIPTSHSCSMAA